MEYSYIMHMRKSGHLAKYVSLLYVQLYIYMYNN